MALATDAPFKQYFDLDGSPLDGGRVYFGVANENPETDPLTVYWDAAATQPAAQPIRTLNGYTVRNGSPAVVYATGDYSITVKDRKGRLVYFVASSASFSNDQNLQDQIDENDIAIRADLASTASGKGAAMVALLRSASGASATTLKAWHDAQVLDAKADFGVVADGVTDDSARMAVALACAVQLLPCTLRLPRGTIKLGTSLGNLAYTGLTLQGAGLTETVLKCTYSGVALYVDAFEPGLTGNDATAPFVEQCNLLDFTVEGNSGTTALVEAQGVARSTWNLNVREADSTSGYGYHLKGVMLSELQLRCSTDINAMTNKPAEGLRMEAGTRDGVNVGNCSNNVLTAPRFVGLPIGMRMPGADQSIVVGGAAESCTNYGLLIGSGSRYNTFVGTGFENPLASSADVADGGVSNSFVGTYSAKSFLLQGRQGTIDGGFHERIEVQSGASKNRVDRVTVNNWASGAGGFVDAGTNTHYGSIYDADLAAFVYPQKSRASITVGSSPFTWTNTTGGFVEVIVQAGTVTQIRQFRDTDNWLKPAASPTCHLCAPGDAIEVSYSSAPTMSYVPYNGLA